MILNQTFAIRVREILKEKRMTQYKLEQLTDLYHSTMNAMMNNRIKSSNFKTMALIKESWGCQLQNFLIVQFLILAIWTLTTKTAFKMYKIFI